MLEIVRKEDMGDRLSDLLEISTRRKMSTGIGPRVYYGTPGVLTSSLRGFWMLFMPDLSWLAMVCGACAAVWTGVRTGLVLWVLGKKA
jgi:hypothetical protein